MFPLVQKYLKNLPYTQYIPTYFSKYSPTNPSVWVSKLPKTAVSFCFSKLLRLVKTTLVLATDMVGKSERIERLWFWSFLFPLHRATAEGACVTQRKNVGGIWSSVNLILERRMTKQEYSDASSDGTVTVLTISQSKIPDGWYYRILVIIKTTFDCFQLLGPCEKHPVTYESLQFTCENVNFLCGNFIHKWKKPITFEIVHFTFYFHILTCSSHVKIANCTWKCGIHMRRGQDLFSRVNSNSRMKKWAITYEGM